MSFGDYDPPFWYMLLVLILLPITIPVFIIYKIWEWFDTDYYGIKFTMWVSSLFEVKNETVDRREIDGFK